MASSVVRSKICSTVAAAAMPSVARRFPRTTTILKGGAAKTSSRCVNNNNQSSSLVSGRNFSCLNSSTTEFGVSCSNKQTMNNYHLTSKQWFSSSTSSKEEESIKETEKNEESSTKTSDQDTTSQDGVDPTELEEAAGPTKEEELQTQIKDLKDQLLRSLAEQENTRRIAKRDVEQARNYAITSFAKSLLDTSDNLERALDSVPEELRTNKETNPELINLYEGIQMTNVGLTKAFEKNHLLKFGKVGEIFNPNNHEALYEYPDPNKEPGTIGQVMKKGFTLNGRVIRPAEVGVVKK